MNTKKLNILAIFSTILTLINIGILIAHINNARIHVIKPTGLNTNSVAIVTNNISTNCISTNNISTNNISTNNISTNNISTNNISTNAVGLRLRIDATNEFIDVPINLSVSQTHNLKNGTTVRVYSK
jgi:hypothetical protein